MAFRGDSAASQTEEGDHGAGASLEFLWLQLRFATAILPVNCVNPFPIRLAPERTAVNSPALEQPVVGDAAKGA